MIEPWMVVVAMVVAAGLLAGRGRGRRRGELAGRGGPLVFGSDVMLEGLMSLNMDGDEMRDRARRRFRELAKFIRSGRMDLDAPVYIKARDVLLIDEELDGDEMEREKCQSNRGSEALSES